MQIAISKSVKLNIKTRDIRVDNLYNMATKSWRKSKSWMLNASLGKF